jgi:hypothetical protein
MCNAQFDLRDISSCCCEEIDRMPLGRRVVTGICRATVERRGRTLARITDQARVRFLCVALDWSERDCHVKRGSELTRIATHACTLSTGTNVPAEEDMSGPSVVWHCACWRFHVSLATTTILQLGSAIRFRMSTGTGRRSKRQMAKITSTSGTA